MATVEMFLEEKERGLYRVEIEVGFPMLRRKEFFADTGAEALRLAAEAFLEFGVDDRARIKMMRPALQADIDRAEAAQQAAGDVVRFAPIGDVSVEYVDASEIANRQRVWLAQGEATAWPMPGDGEEPTKRKPGRPRKEA